MIMQNLEVYPVHLSPAEIILLQEIILAREIIPARGNTNMSDIFDMKILCKNCNLQMKPRVLEKEGLQLRAIECPKCKDKIVHPADLNCMNKFNDLKGKTFNVKLRMVGNSHTVSIPKEIVDLINEQHSLMNEQHKRMRRQMDEMVKLAFEDFGKLRLSFFDEDEGTEEEQNGR